MDKKLENIALFDLDGSLADYDKSMKHYLGLIKSPNESTEDCYNHDLPWVKERTELIKSIPNFWYKLEKINAGFKVLELVQNIGFIPHVLTKAPKRHPMAWAEKSKWCRKHLPGINVTLTEDKGLVYGKVLFDDWPPYMLRWLEWRPRGLGIMLDSDYNKDFSHPRVIKVYRENIEDSLYKLERPLIETYNR